MQDNLPKAPVTQVGESTPVFDAAKAARSPYGDLEVTKYLYESGLQNIFNTYQQNIATLSQNKQQELQDAYYIREMSKKYLGEYASNVGIGDVSGNLLDIYGQYQSNLTDIERNYDQLQMGLDQQFQQKRQETMNDLLLTEYNIEVAKLAEADKQVLFNIQMGNIPEGMTDMEYLQQEYEAGRISQEAYQQESINLMENQRTAEERAVWGQIVRGELSKEELTAAYEAGQISVEAYNQYFNAMEQQERQDVLRGIEFNIQQNNMGNLSTRDYLEQQLKNGVITEAEYQNLISLYAGDPRQEVFSDVSFNIANGTIPSEYADAKAYIEANRATLGEDNYRQLMLGETLKEKGVEAFTLYQDIINGRLPEGTIAADAIEQGVRDGLFSFDQAALLYEAVAKKEAAQAVSDVKFNILTGNTGGLGALDYINQVYSSGTSGLTEDQYRSLVAEEVNKENQKKAVNYLVDLATGKYGDMTLEQFIDYGIENNFLTPELATTYLLQERSEEKIAAVQGVVDQIDAGADPDTVLAEAVDKGTITQEEADAIQSQINQATQEAIASFETTYSLSDTVYSGIDENGQVVQKESPYGNAVNQLGIEDFTYLFDDPNITSDTELVIYGIGGIENIYAKSTEAAALDRSDFKEFDSSIEVFEPGKVYQYEDGQYYIYQNDQFFQLYETDIKPEQFTKLQNQVNRGAFSFSGQTTQGFGDNWEWNSNGDGRDTFTYNGIEYIEDTEEWRSTTSDKEEQDIINEFKRIYGDKNTTQIIFYKNSFYIRDAKGKYQKLIKK